MRAMRAWMGVWIVAAVAACASSGQGTAARELDGSWSETFAADRDATYHATLDAFLAEGYTLQKANGPGGTFTARSPVRTRKIPILPDRISYTMAHVVVEAAPEGDSRVRLSLLRADDPANAAREPNNDRAIEDRAVYEEWFDRVGERLK